MSITPTEPELRFTLAEGLIYSTVRVKTFKTSGLPNSSGTAFFYRVDFPPNHNAIFLVTNKHVVRDSAGVSFDVHLAAGKNENYRPSGRTISIDLSLDSDGVFNHPDPDVDLCFIGLGDLAVIQDKVGEGLFFNVTGASLVPNENEWKSIDAIEEVTMVGCPRGLFDEVNKLPLVRQGITATSAYTDFCGRPEFMVDMACFPGSSGSPIFTRQTAVHVDRATCRTHFGPRRAMLLGILYAGPQVTLTGDLVLGQQAHVEVASMMHLGQAIRSTQLLVIENMIRALAPALANLA